jgi:hypothetical protein
MHIYSLLSLVAVASAVAIPVHVSKRQFGVSRTSFMESEFSQSSTCGKVVFVWARGSTEIGNMVSIFDDYISMHQIPDNRRALLLARLLVINSAPPMERTYRLKVLATLPK